jgi:hypothetical protein
MRLLLLLAIVLISQVALSQDNFYESLDRATEAHNRSFLTNLKKFEVMLTFYNGPADSRELQQSYKDRFKKQFGTFDIPGSILPPAWSPDFKIDLTVPTLLVTIKKIGDDYRLEAGLFENAKLDRSARPFRTQTWTFRVSYLQKYVETKSLYELGKEVDSFIDHFCLEYLAANKK